MTSVVFDSRCVEKTCERPAETRMNFRHIKQAKFQIYPNQHRVEPPVTDNSSKEDNSCKWTLGHDTRSLCSLRKHINFVISRMPVYRRFDCLQLEETS